MFQYVSYSENKNNININNTWIDTKYWTSTKINKDENEFVLNVLNKTIKDEKL